MTPPPDPEALLQDCNPVLVIFPQDPKRCLRPGAARLPGTGKRWGDYHPCGAEFFLDRVVKRPEPKGFNPLEAIAALVPWAKDRSAPSGIAAIKGDITTAVQQGRVPETRDWELDLAGLPSQNERNAWTVYGEMLADKGRVAYKPVVYGRVFRRDSYVALQYWYLYAYNDFFNNHEADWEMVNIELSPATGKPAFIGVSCHQGGNWLAWDDAPKDMTGRPVVRVARGSHSGYFVYERGGHDPVNVIRRANPPPPLTFLTPILRHLPRIPWKKDFAPAFRESAGDANAPDGHYGERVDLKLLPLPDPPPAIGATGWDGFWWRHYQGKWGSCHTRLIGTIGVDSPWGPSDHPERWDTPWRWMEFIGRPSNAV